MVNLNLCYNQVVSRVSDIQMLPDFATSALDPNSYAMEIYLQMQHKQGHYTYAWLHNYMYIHNLLNYIL